MGLDQRLPESLSLFSQEINRTETGVPYRPRLRRLVQEWLDDETAARRWMDYLYQNEDEIDPSLQKILLPLLKAMIGEPATEKAEVAKTAASEQKV